ncbi:hypothetical protein D3C72_1569760 [compost metagenome]
MMGNSALAASTCCGVSVLSTSRPASGLPPVMPTAAATGRPIMPVPGTPTPMPFLNRLPLTQTLIRVGSCPSSLRQLAAASATDMGSVQPRAGTTSRLSRVIKSVHCAFICGFSGSLCRRHRIGVWVLSGGPPRPCHFI